MCCCARPLARDLRDWEIRKSTAEVVAAIHFDGTVAFGSTVTITCKGRTQIIPHRRS